LRITWTDEVYRIYEVDTNFKHDLDIGISFYTPESQLIISQAIKRAIQFAEPFDLELEIITAKGNLRSVHTIGRIDVENNRVYGFSQDITKRKEIENNFLASQLNFFRTISDSPIGIRIVTVEGIPFMSTKLSSTFMSSKVWRNLQLHQPFSATRTKVTFNTATERKSGETEESCSTTRLALFVKTKRCDL